jgi:hypothetical protein
MPSEKPAGPITVALGPKKKTFNITAEELFAAISGFLRQNGIEVGPVEYSGEHVPRSRDGEPSYSSTDVYFHSITENGIAWERERRIHFTIEGKCTTALSTRLGSGPFVLQIYKYPYAGGALLFHVVVQPNPDRTVTFSPVKGVEGEKDNIILY